MNPNPYFDPATCPFECLGFFEELLDTTTGKCHGIRDVAEPDRPLGYAGRKWMTLTENVTLRKGHNTVVLKASPSKPKNVIAMLHVLCGKVKS